MNPPNIGSKMKYFLCIILMLYSITSSNIGGYIETSREAIVRGIFSKIIDTESSHRHYFENGDVRLSDEGSIGICQIMPIALKYYNYRNDIDISWNELHDRLINLKVGYWIFSNNLYYFNNDLIDAVNSYNMGVYNTEIGRYKPKYISNVLPDLYQHWENQQTIISNIKGIITVLKK